MNEFMSVIILEQAGFSRVDVGPNPYWAIQVGDIELAFEPRIFGGFELALYRKIDGTPYPELVFERKLQIEVVS